jgi:hypothetical protein
MQLEAARDLEWGVALGHMHAFPAATVERPL